MCKTNQSNFNNIKATYVGPLLRNFPQCGVRYRTFGDHALVLVSPAVKDQALIKSKREAAALNSLTVTVAEIPAQIAAVFNIGVPALVEAV